MPGLAVNAWPSVLAERLGGEVVVERHVFLKDHDPVVDAGDVIEIVDWKAAADDYSSASLAVIVSATRTSRRPGHCHVEGFR